MEVFILIAFLAVGVACFYIFRKIDIFIEKSTKYVDNTKRVSLIHLGFDEPYLVEDFVLKMKQADQGNHTMEIVTYTGTEKEMVEMLLTGKLDYIVLTHTISDWDSDQGECKELHLRPYSMRVNHDETHNETSEMEPVKTDVFWIPKWIGKDIDYFSKLLMEQS